MATRSGTVDPGLLLELMRRGYSETALTEILQKNSGLKGLSGISGDMRKFSDAARSGHNGAVGPIEVFRHRLLQLIGAMTSTLHRVDVLALTGDIGEHLHELRNELKDCPSELSDKQSL